MTIRDEFMLRDRPSLDSSLGILSSGVISLRPSEPDAPAPQLPLRVAVIGDHTLTRQALVAAMGEQVGLAPEGQLTFEELLNMTPDREQAPDLCLIDLDALDADHLTRLLSRLARLPRCIFISCVNHDRFLQQVLKGNAQGFIDKGVSFIDMVDALFRAAAGETVISTVVSERISRARGGDVTPLQRLSPREREILHLIASGLPKKQISERIGISVKTIETLSDRLMKKLKIHDRVMLTRFAIREGIIVP